MIDLARLSFRNVEKGRKRTILTMLGIFIGIAAVVALVSLGQGFQQTINEQFEKVGADKIIVQAKDVGFGGSTNVPGQLTKDDLRVVNRARGVIESAGQVFQSAFVEFNDIQRTRFVMSIPTRQREADLIDAFMTWEAEDGRLITHRDSGKVVVGHDIAHKNVFESEVRVGNKVKVNGVTFKVVGIAKRTGDPGMDGGIVMSEDDARDVLDIEEAYTYLVVQAAASEDPEDVAGRVEREIRRDRDQDEGEEDFTVQTATELIASFNSVLLVVQIVFVGIALISLLVGGIGIMNTMFTAVLERTREIAVMKAIGAQNQDILRIFLIESGMLGLAGGVVGVLIGAGISKGVEVMVNSAFGAGTLHAIYPVYLIAGTLAFSTIVGMVSGYLPARRASRLQPADNLRYE